jgi:hypothetical protein
MSCQPKVAKLWLVGLWPADRDSGGTQTNIDILREGSIDSRHGSVGKISGSGFATSHNPTWKSSAADVLQRRGLHGVRGVAGDGCRLARLTEQCDTGRGASGYTRTRSHWLSLRRRPICASFGASDRSHPPSQNTRATIQITETTIIGSRPPNTPEYPRIPPNNPPRIIISALTCPASAGS